VNHDFQPNDVEPIRNALNENGVVRIRGLIPASTVRMALGELDTLSAAAGLLGEADSLQTARVDDDVLLQLRGVVYGSKMFHAMSHNPELLSLTSRLLGNETIVQPRKFLRVATPRARQFATQPHQDHRFVQGTVDVLTTWIPLHDVDADSSPMRFVLGSHREGLQTIVETNGEALPSTVVGDLDWTTLECNRGDVLMFHSLTLHSTLSPRNSLNRLSFDFRYQSRKAPMAESAKLAPYVCPPEDDGFPERWAKDPQLDLSGVRYLPDVHPNELAMPVTESVFLS
jgi:hypothetical protein